MSDGGRPAPLGGVPARQRLGVRQAQPADGDLDAVLHPGVVGVEVAGEAAVFQLEPVGVLEVDRLGPVVVDDVRDLDALGPQLPALRLEPRLRARLEGEVPASYCDGTPGTPRASMKAMS